MTQTSRQTDIKAVHEITPEMIRAGADAVEQAYPASPVYLAEVAYLAMEAARCADLARKDKK